AMIMANLFCSIVEITLFNNEAEGGIVIYPASAGQENAYFTPLDDSFPAWCELCPLPDSEAYLPALRKVLTDKQPQRVFLIPPVLQARDLSVTLRREYPGWHLQDIAMVIAASLLEEGALLGAILPSGFCRDQSSKSARSQIFQHSQPSLLIAL